MIKSKKEHGIESVGQSSEGAESGGTVNGSEAENLSAEQEAQARAEALWNSPSARAARITEQMIEHRRRKGGQKCEGRARLRPAPYTPSAGKAKR